MSHWAEAKLGLKCSLGVLQTALIGVMKQFNLNISPSSVKTDPEGKLKANGYGGRNAKDGYNLVTKLKYSDIGFKQQADGTWIADYDSMEFQGARLEKELISEVAVMKTKARASMNKYQIQGGEREGNEITFYTIIPNPEEQQAF